MSSSSFKELSFRWWSFIQADKGELDGFGFPKENGSEDHAFALDGSWASDASSSSTTIKHKNPHWFFSVEDNESLSYSSNGDSTPFSWNDRDDAMLDTLLQDNLSEARLVDEVPNLEWSMSFEETSWMSKSKDKDFFVAPRQEDIFISKEIFWNEGKFYDLEEALSVTSSETGSNVTDYDDHSDGDVSTLTASEVSSIQTSESNASEEKGWYQAKIASMMVSKKKRTATKSSPDLEVWAKKLAPSMIGQQDPPLVQVSADELTRRMEAMQERQEKQALLQNVVNSSTDPELRRDAQEQLKELWITTYTKKSRSHASAPSSEATLAEL